jgi:parallel beta-helix repeat protein
MPIPPKFAMFESPRHNLSRLIVAAGILALLFLPRGFAQGVAPSVDAGPALVLNFPAKDLTLFGHVTEMNNPPMIVNWTLLNGPAGVMFSNQQATTTTVTFTTTGTYTFQLSASDGTATGTGTTTVTVNPASAQTAFYVSPTYVGGSSDGSAAHPWTSLLDNDSDYRTKWTSILAALASRDVIIYFAARQAGSDTPEVLNSPGGRLFINRRGHCGNPNTPLPCDAMGPHRLTLDGMSLYSTNDTSPNWVAYTGTNRFKLNETACGSLGMGWDDDVKRDYITLRGIEVTGVCARIIVGGDSNVLEYIWSHDVTGIAAQMMASGAVGDYPACPDLGKYTGLTMRNNKVERGRGEGLYVAGNYLLTRYGGCPAYGNTHHDILIENNVVTDSGINGEEGDGIDLKAGLINVTVRGNVFTNAHNSSEGVLNWNGTFNNTPDYMLVENNVINGCTGACESGISVGNSHGAVVRNNLVYNLPVEAMYACSDPTFPSNDITIYNNTFYGNTHGFSLCETTRFTFKNNIVVANGAAPQINTDGTSTSILSDYNLIAPPGTAGIAEGTHSIQQASTTGIFVNLSGTPPDFHLASGSPAIGRGQNLRPLSTLANFVTQFTIDIAGHARQVSSPWDIGAYLFGSSGPPSAPQNLRIVR